MIELKHHVKYKKGEKQHITLHHTDWFVGWATTITNNHHN